MLDAGQLGNERSPCDALILPLIEMLNERVFPSGTQFPSIPAVCPVLPFIQVSCLFGIVCIVTGGLGFEVFLHLEDMKYSVRQELLAI